MKLKTNLHFHTAEDPNDGVEYTLKEGIDRAAEDGFDALAVTCHQYAAWNKEAAEYAELKGVLLISGIEVSIDEKKPKDMSGKKIKGKHVVLLNVDKEAEAIRTFKDLEKYKSKNPGVFAIAAHPYFKSSVCLGGLLEKHIGLFDAIEHSWYYSSVVNFNKKAEDVAKKYGLPLVATSDTHFFYDDHLNRNYIVVEAEKTVHSILEAIKNNNFNNITRPSSLFKHLFWAQQVMYRAKDKLITKNHKLITKN